MERRDLVNFWNEIHTVIDNAVEKRDRSVAIYISPDSGMTVNVYPWPSPEDLYDMYQQGKITFNDFRAKAGLPPMDEVEFLRQSTRYIMQKVEEGKEGD